MVDWLFDASGHQPIPIFLSFLGLKCDGYFDSPGIHECNNCFRDEDSENCGMIVVARKWSTIMLTIRVITVSENTFVFHLFASSVSKCLWYAQPIVPSITVCTSTNLRSSGQSYTRLTFRSQMVLTHQHIQRLNSNFSAGVRVPVARGR